MLVNNNKIMKKYHLEKKLLFYMINFILYSLFYRFLIES